MSHKKRLMIAASEHGHSPRWQYDCGRCKFNWCCGPTCACILAKHTDKFGDPPRWRQRQVDKALIEAGLHTQYRKHALERLKDPR